MKLYRLNIKDNNYRSGFTFKSKEMLDNRINRALNKMQNLNKTLKEIVEHDGETELVVDMVLA